MAADSAAIRIHEILDCVAVIFGAQTANVESHFYVTTRSGSIAASNGSGYNCSQSGNGYLTMRTLLIAATFLVSTCWATEPTWVIGSRNPNLAEGAQALLGGRNEEGIRLTLLGLKAAAGEKEEEIALSNLCAGYTNLGDYDTALKYCDILLQRNDKLWRVYNSKALIFIFTKQYDKAEQELIKGEALRPGAHSLKIARALYMDATHPVAPHIEVDDRRTDEQPDLRQN